MFFGRVRRSSSHPITFITLLSQKWIGNYSAYFAGKNCVRIKSRRSSYYSAKVNYSTRAGAFSFNNGIQIDKNFCHTHVEFGRLNRQEWIEDVWGKDVQHSGSRNMFQAQVSQHDACFKDWSCNPRLRRSASSTCTWLPINFAC